jgi:hypothetical protein
MTKTYKVASRRQWKAEELDGLKPTVYDWCRMAAFLDGEGCLQFNPYKRFRRKGQVRIIVLNTNPALPTWILQTFGGNVVIRDHNNPKWKISYCWSCTAGRAAWIMHNCLPWFLLKKAQAELLLELQTHIDQTRQGRGRQISDEECAYRDGVHVEIKKLNAKGPVNQKPISLTGE